MVITKSRTKPSNDWKIFLSVNLFNINHNTKICIYIYPHAPLPQLHSPRRPDTQTHTHVERKQRTQIHHSQDQLIQSRVRFDSKNSHKESPLRLWDVPYAIRAFDFRRREGSRNRVGEGAIKISLFPIATFTHTQHSRHSRSFHYLLGSSNLNSTHSDFSDTESMAAKVLKEAKSLTAVEAGEVDTAVSSVKCCCCGLMEECTHAYIARVRERYGGRWICGLCAEAVKEEREREKIVITTDEALKRHTRFCQQFKSSTPPDNTNEDFILAVKQILFRTLDSPRKDRFTCRPLGRSHSCFSTMQGTPTQAETE